MEILELTVFRKCRNCIKTLSFLSHIRRTWVMSFWQIVDFGGDTIIFHVMYFLDYVQVNSVRLPRHVADKRLFCGTALVEFATDEDAEKVLNQNMAYAGVELDLKAK